LEVGRIARVHAIAYSRMSFIKIMAVSNLVKERAELLSKEFDAKAIRAMRI
jgi:hypothetical protein